MSPSVNQRACSPRRFLAVAALVLMPFTLSCGRPQQVNTSNQTPVTPSVTGDPTAQLAADGAPLPRKPPPQGMVELPSGGVGRILTSQMSGTASARKMLMALHRGIEGYFDARPVVTAAFADVADQNLQAAFTAKLGGVPVRGVMAIQMRGDSGQATLIFDRWAAFPQTFARLAQGIGETGSGEGGRGGAPAPVQLTPTQLPDGSGQISLPPGWRITGAYKGTVDAVGPNGEGMSLGGPNAVNSPAAGGLYPNVPTVNFNDPVQAFRDFMAYHRQEVRILDARPVQVQAAGRWAFIRYQAMANGQSVDALGLFGIMPVDEIQGILYISYAAAPSRVFKDSLPGMWAAWQSWGVSDAVFRERIKSAVSSMRETGEILTGSYWSRQDTNARVNKAWSNYIRDEGLWRDPSDPNTHYRIPNAVLPADGNMGRLEPVPLKDIQP